MKQITDYEVHQQLTFLYLAFAHQTDFDLSDKEIKYITEKIIGWYPDIDWDIGGFYDDFQEVMQWYSDTCILSEQAMGESAKKAFLDQFEALVEKGKIDVEFMNPIMTTVMAIAKHFGQVLTEENGWDSETKIKIIREINELAKVDGQVNANEKEWLVGLGKDMGL